MHAGFMVLILTFISELAFSQLQDSSKKVSAHVKSKPFKLSWLFLLQKTVLSKYNMKHNFICIISSLDCNHVKFLLDLLNLLDLFIIMYHLFSFIILKKKPYS
jgi:hypothetical protein